MPDLSLSETSEAVEQGPCEVCGSSDANTLYSDGHHYCFSCDKYLPPGQDAPAVTVKNDSSLLDGQFADLRKRMISESTCKKYGYRVTKHNGAWLQVADYRDAEGRRVVAQKVRGEDKRFYTLGAFKNVGLFGQHLWPGGGKRIVICEGELDCLTVAQMQDCKWPVVSLPTGAASAKKALGKQLKWLLNFTEIVLMFDDDEAGCKAAAECASLFPPGQCKIATIAGHKDASEALMALDGQAIVRAIYDAKEYRPDGILSISDLREQVLTPPEVGLSWPWHTLTRHTYGRRRGELYFLGAGTGVGKTDVFMQVAAHIEQNEETPVGAFYLEQSPQETIKRVAGKIARRRFHIPDDGWTQDELIQTLDRMERNNRMFLYDSFGTTEWDVIKNHIRFLAVSSGVKDVFIDHLTALASTGDDERGSLEVITKEMAMLAHELHITIYCISHLATPEGRSHEEGGRVTIRQFKGSRAIGYWAHFMFALERDQQSDDEEWRNTTTFRILKDRYTGNSTGELFFMGYDRDTGLLSERCRPGDSNGFSDETNPNQF